MTVTVGGHVEEWMHGESDEANRQRCQVEIRTVVPSALRLSWASPHIHRLKSVDA